MKRRGSRFCVFPGYKWCGPGCSGPGAPFNEVDAACKGHDECYRSSRNYCECDYEFLRRLRPLINPSTRTGRHASLLYDYMKFQILLNCGFNRR
ncbi:phospholipase [Lederbergia citri]|uniref:Phospholipase n=1 Tax=Lederbergia citri TaxID=2833580 RepID=A0A942YGI4_9BACI|nr:phospholipase [Lederbergia citri]MBS4196188.1 phospholipase [Lederbergia citri]